MINNILSILCDVKNWAASTILLIGETASFSLARTYTHEHPTHHLETIIPSPAIRHRHLPLLRRHGCFSTPLPTARHHHDEHSTFQRTLRPFVRKKPPLHTYTVRPNSPAPLHYRTTHIRPSTYHNHPPPAPPWSHPPARPPHPHTHPHSNSHAATPLRRHIRFFPPAPSNSHLT